METKASGERQGSVGDAPSGAPALPGRRRTGAASRPIVPGPRMSTRSPADRFAARTARRALPPGSTIAPAASSIVSGSACTAVTGTASCSASAPGKPPRMPISNRSRADVVPAGQAPAALAAAQHGVAGDPPAEPRRVDARPDRRHRAAPLVAEPHRVARLTGCRYAISPVKNSTSVPQTPTRATSTTTWPGAAPRRRHLLHRRRAGSGDDERPHRAAITICRWVPRPSMPSSMTSPGSSQIGGVMPHRRPRAGCRC